MVTFDFINLKSNKFYFLAVNIQNYWKNRHPARGFITGLFYNNLNDFSFSEFRYLVRNFGTYQRICEKIPRKMRNISRKPKFRNIILKFYDGCVFNEEFGKQRAANDSVNAANQRARRLNFQFSKIFLKLSVKKLIFRKQWIKLNLY